MVCPLFGHYSRYHQTLQSLPEGDSRHTNISLITLVSEKLAEASCEQVSVLYQHLYLLVRSVYLDLQVKTQCSEGQECANMSCNISSISEACLTVPSKDDLSTEMDENIALLRHTNDTNGNHVKITQSWLRQISSRHDMTRNVVTLAPGGIVCGSEGNGGVINCSYSFSS